MKLTNILIVTFLTILSSCASQDPLQGSSTGGRPGKPGTGGSGGGGGGGDFEATYLAQLAGKKLSKGWAINVTLANISPDGKRITTLDLSSISGASYLSKKTMHFSYATSADKGIYVCAMTVGGIEMEVDMLVTIAKDNKGRPMVNLSSNSDNVHINMSFGLRNSIG